MVLMMILPLILLVLLPKIMSDPETKKELESMQMPQMGQGLPDMSDMLTRFLGGGGTPKPAAAAASGSGERQKPKKRN